MIGKMLGYYEITSLLGRGATGEVYQAKDCRLERDVAVGCYEILAPIGAGAVNRSHYVYRCARVPN